MPFTRAATYTILQLLLPPYALVMASISRMTGGEGGPNRGGSSLWPGMLLTC
jgi:hypothetical protein